LVGVIIQQVLNKKEEDEKMALKSLFNISVILALLSAAVAAPQGEVPTSTAASAAAAIAPAEGTTSDASMASNPQVGGFIKGILAFIGKGLETAGTFVQNPEVQKAVGGLVDNGAKAVQGALANPDEAADKGSEILESFVKTANETGPALNKGQEQLGSLGQILGNVAENVAPKVIDNIFSFADTFRRRMDCNKKCKGKTGDDLTTCEKENCDGFIKSQFAFIDPDYNPEDYGEYDPDDF